MEDQDRGTELIAKIRDMQQKMEAYQILLNTSQREAEAARQGEAEAREAGARLRSQMEIAEKKIVGYRQQLAQTQSVGAAVEALTAQLTQAKQENEALTAQLTQAKQEKEALAARVTELEQSLPVRMYHKLRPHR